MTGSYSVAICDGSIVLPSVSLSVVSFEFITGDMFVMACFYRCIFAAECAITSVFLLVEFGGVPINFIKLILGLQISIL